MWDRDSPCASRILREFLGGAIQRLPKDSGGTALVSLHPEFEVSHFRVFFVIFVVIL